MNPLTKLPSRRNQLGLECLFLIILGIFATVCWWPAVVVGCAGGLMLGLPMWIFWNCA